ncbi:hypothetical protein NPIL_140511 [Nephila pilipes]|uniref:Uncharacterized protein n=1 Tax=Nephila pilipes TaxID=299642 RepID=A0A8X6TA98_NEPPI|nr:hypothetical protein NPIL_140511 [Nephila pilipes]
MVTKSLVRLVQADFGIQSPGTWRCGVHGNRLSVRVQQHPEHVTGMPTSSTHLFNSPWSRVCGLGRSFLWESIPIFQTATNPTFPYREIARVLFSNPPAIRSSLFLFRFFSSEYILSPALNSHSCGPFCNSLEQMTIAFLCSLDALFSIVPFWRNRSLN